MRFLPFADLPTPFHATYCKTARTPLLASLLLALSPLVANAVSPVVPGAGALLQEIQPVKPPAPSPIGTVLTIEPQGSALLPSSAPFLVKTINISGNTLFDTALLHALVADSEGKSVTLAQLNELAERITVYYRTHGYPLARALIPAQTIALGVVRIDIMEARYGKVTLNNDSRTDTPLLLATLSSLQSGQFISQAELDHVLLLLSDIPGVVVDATLKQGEAVATSDLLVGTTSSAAVSGNAVLDNDGNRYTGRARMGVSVNSIDPLRHGDVFSVSGLSSGNDMNYGRLSYESLVNGDGTRAGTSYSALRYALGQPLASLDAHGTAQVASVWMKHPFLRGRDVNLYGQIQYDRVQLHDHIDANALKTDRHLQNWTVNLSGDASDALLSGATNAWNVGLTRGYACFDDDAAQLADAATAHTQGSFSKWNANLVRLQNLDPANSLSLSVSGQWAHDNLDSSQKMVAGGPDNVRAYDVGAVSGDAGYVAKAELRHDLGWAWSGRWQAVVFVDNAHVMVNKSAWATGANSATLSGAGMGLMWAGSDKWSARTYIAAPIGARPALVADTATARGWVEISRAF